MSPKPPTPMLSPESTWARLVQSNGEHMVGKTVGAFRYEPTVTSWVVTFTDGSEVWLPGPSPPKPLEPREKPVPLPPRALPHSLPHPCAVCGLLCRNHATTEQIPPPDRRGPFGYTVQHLRCPPRFWRPLLRFGERLGF